MQSRQGVMHFRIKGKRDKIRFVPVHPMVLRLIGEYLQAGKHGGAVSHESLDSPLFRPVANNRTGTLDILTGQNMAWMDVGEMVKQLNQKLGGWANYFKLGPVTPVYRFIDRYSKTRLRRWLCKKHKRRDRGVTYYPDEHFYNQLGLIRLSKLPQNSPWAKA